MSTSDAAPIISSAVLRREQPDPTALIQAAFEHGPYGVLLTDARGRVMLCNAVAAAIAGRSVDSLTDLPLRDLVSDPDRESFESWLAGVDGVAGNEWEGALSRPDGATVTVCLASARGADGTGLLSWIVREDGDRRGAADNLRRDAERARAIIAQAVTGIALVDLSGRPVQVNDAITRFLGYSAEELYAKVFTEFTYPDDAALDWELFQEVLAGRRRHYQIEKRYIRKDGVVVWGRLTVSIFHERDAEPTHVVAMVEDITTRRQAEETARQAETRFRSLVQKSSDIIAIVDSDAIVRYVSPSVQSVLGVDPEAIVGTDAWGWLNTGDTDMVRCGLERTMPEGDSTVPFEARVQRADGSWCAFEVLATDLRDDPAVAGVVINARDITERKRLEDELRQRAFFDALTGLPNRALFVDRLGHALTSALRRGRPVAVLFLDLDGFKVINDSLGHPAGDLILTAVGRRLSSCVRAGDTVARFGGDEFAVLAEEMVSADDALALADRINTVLREPFALEGREVVVTASTGISVRLPEQEIATPDDVLREADIALYHAKQAGKARASRFDTEMNRAAIDRLDLESELRGAVERGELRVFHQPIVDLRNGAILGTEALLRWQHPTRGLLPPDQFIPLAEETGLIVPIGMWVIEEACRQVMAWPSTGRSARALELSVNLCVRQLHQPDLVEQLRAVLSRCNFPPERLHLEITESALVEDGTGVARTLQGLRELGVRLAIDDFGTGYSSLGYLQWFPAATVKIDRSFVRPLETDTGAGAIIRAVTTLARALKMGVTVEGIETRTQLARLRSLGCRRGQGYYFARPAPADTIPGLLRDGGFAPLLP